MKFDCVFKFQMNFVFFRNFNKLFCVFTIVFIESKDLDNEKFWYEDRFFFYFVFEINIFMDSPEMGNSNSGAGVNSGVGVFLLGVGVGTFFQLRFNPDWYHD